MSDTMTLEDVRDLLASYGNAFMDAVRVVDGAIRERDELRERALNLATGLQEWQALHAEQETRAEKAEVELAALKARIFHGIVLDVDDLARGHAGLPSEWRGKRVRLVQVEDDDV